MHKTQQSTDDPTRVSFHREKKQFEHWCAEKPNQREKEIKVKRLSNYQINEFMDTLREQIRSTFSSVHARLLATKPRWCLFFSRRTEKVRRLPERSRCIDRRTLHWSSVHHYPNHFHSDPTNWPISSREKQGSSSSHFSLGRTQLPSYRIRLLFDRRFLPPPCHPFLSCRPTVRISPRTISVDRDRVWSVCNSEYLFRWQEVGLDWDVAMSLCVDWSVERVGRVLERPTVGNHAWSGWRALSRRFDL